MNNDKIILVSGATGQQGGAVSRHLLAKGWRVRGLTRDASSAKAQALAAAGAEVVEGNMEDPASLDRALDGVYGVFSVQNFWLPGVGAAGEVRQGINLADAAQAAGVEHFVYSSVGGAERRTGIPHFESKWQIEEHVRALGLPATIFRPVAFMDNYNWSRPAILNGSFTGFGLRPDKTLQLIAADDIGAFVALAFEQPEAYLGRAIEIAGDELTEPQIAETFARVIGRPVVAGRPMTQDSGPPDEEALKMIRWFNESGYQADIPALRRIYPGLQTLEQWLRRTGWENAEPEPISAGAGWS
ncbi:MAG: NmrA/HSCARG family protein [Chloroflexi bacterium]|nr:NmrA/HSCARG family protein [Chloroflexota bacterium]MCI0575682.1 NmrA/HSCARG family protein [Chloroflexota bacterium]MCI0647813.1 NmrA/HSCARG family protein [Chloroflexota bacterium]MCI0725177.1 NmrA/HSCARG family protein [Chloroflexota bacterium]